MSDTERVPLGDIDYQVGCNQTLNEKIVAKGLRLSMQQSGQQPLSDFDSIAHDMLDPDHGPLIAVSAYDAGRIIGFGVTHPQHSRATTTARADYAIDIAVAPTHQGRAVATTILEGLERPAMIFGVQAFVIEGLSKKAAEFYGRRGYKQIVSKTGLAIMEKAVGSRPRARSRSRS